MCSLVATIHNNYNELLVNQGRLLSEAERTILSDSYSSYCMLSYQYNLREEDNLLGGTDHKLLCVNIIFYTITLLRLAENVHVMQLICQ